ncbi:MAG: hypothetical protein ACJ8AH_03470 [Stellaceae bacterium]
MTEGLTIEAGPSSWRPADFTPPKARYQGSPAELVKLPLPKMRPGQLWFAEITSADPVPASLEHQALTSANVIIYDRALAPTVSRFLPLGGYAEPAAPSRLSFNATWDRCLRFAREGWSVARLVHPSREQLAAEVRNLSRLLLGGGLAPDLVVVFANLGDGVYEKSQMALCELDAALGLGGFAESLPLTIVCDVVHSGASSHASAASTNGLAG